MLSRFREEGFEFLLKAFNTPNYLEDLTGLSQLYAETDDDQVSVWDVQFQDWTTHEHVCVCS